MSFDLPALPEGWRFVPLETCAVPGSISYGVVQPGAPVEAGKPIIRVNNFKEGRLDLSEVMHIAPEVESKYARTRLVGGEVLLTLVGSVGQVAEVPLACFGFNVARAVGVVKPAKGFEAKWLAICLRSPLSQHLLGSRANTTVQTTINLKDVRALPIPIPPVAERVQITEMVAALDDRIALLRETNATLEAIAQALFKSWFVDFDPVRAKQQGLAPAGVDEATAALFPDSFDESALGLVPKGWQVETIDDLCDIITNGGTPSRSNGAFWTGGMMPWFKTGDFADGFLLAPAERISEAAIAGSSVKVLPANAILMAIYAAPTVGRLGVLTEAATFNQACTGMVAKTSVGPWYLLLTLFFGRAWFNSRANGAAQQNISKAIVASYQAVVATAPLLARFHEIADGLYCRIRANSEQAQTLSTLRGTLLPRLISGQLRLPEFETEAALG